MVQDIILVISGILIFGGLLVALKQCAITFYYHNHMIHLHWIIVIMVTLFTCVFIVSGAMERLV